MKKITHYTALLLCLLLWISEAEAAKVKNLDDVAYTIKVENVFQVEEITIEPDAFYYTTSPSIVVTLGDNDPVRISYQQEYGIVNGKLRVLRRNTDVNPDF